MFATGGQRWSSSVLSFLDVVSAVRCLCASKRWARAVREVPSLARVVAVCAGFLTRDAVLSSCPADCKAPAADASLAAAALWANVCQLGAWRWRRYDWAARSTAELARLAEALGAPTQAGKEHWALTLPWAVHTNVAFFDCDGRNSAALSTEEVTVAPELSNRPGQRIELQLELNLWEGSDDNAGTVLEAELWLADFGVDPETVKGSADVKLLLPSQTLVGDSFAFSLNRNGSPTMDGKILQPGCLSALESHGLLELDAARQYALCAQPVRVLLSLTARGLASSSSSSSC